MSLNKNPYPEQWNLGWLSPKGEFYTMNGHSGHERVAYDIIDGLGINEEYEKWEENNNYSYGYEYLEFLGWIRLHGYTEPLWILYDITPTFVQKQKIKQWLKFRGLSWDKGVRE